MSRLHILVGFSLLMPLPSNLIQSFPQYNFFYFLYVTNDSNSLFEVKKLFFRYKFIIKLLFHHLYELLASYIYKHNTSMTQEELEKNITQDRLVHSLLHSLVHFF